MEMGCEGLAGDGRVKQRNGKRRGSERELVSRQASWQADRQTGIPEHRKTNKHEARSQEDEENY